MKNLEVARLFNLMADVLELQEENVFRIRAYRPEGGLAHVATISIVVLKANARRVK